MKMLELVYFTGPLLLVQLLLLKLPFSCVDTSNHVQQPPQNGVLIVTITKSGKNKHVIDINRPGIQITSDEIASINKILSKMLAPNCKISLNGNIGIEIKCTENAQDLASQLIKLAEVFILSANSLFCSFNPPIVYADMIVLIQTAPDLSTSEVNALINGILQLKNDVAKMNLQIHIQPLNRFMVIELVPNGKGGLPPCVRSKTHKTTTHKMKHNTTTTVPKSSCLQVSGGGCKSNDDCCQHPVKLFCYQGYYCTCIGDGAPCIDPSFTGDNVERCCTGYCDPTTKTCGAPKGGCQPKGFPCTDDYKVPCCDDLTCIVNSTGSICAECHKQGESCLLNNGYPGCCAGMICVSKKLSSDIGVCKKV